MEDEDQAIEEEFPINLMILKEYYRDQFFKYFQKVKISS